MASESADQRLGVSGITRFASGLPVTFASSSDNYLVQVQNNGVNATSIDMPNYDGTGYKINRNPRNGKSLFNADAFTPNALGTQGNSKRRMFYGPGIDNFDMALHKVTNFTEGRSLELRLEMFNVFNHAQFYGGNSVDGNIGDKKRPSQRHDRSRESRQFRSCHKGGRSPYRSDRSEVQFLSPAVEASAMPSTAFCFSIVLACS